MPCPSAVNDGEGSVRILLLSLPSNASPSSGLGDWAMHRIGTEKALPFLGRTFLFLVEMSKCNTIYTC
ncbi:hypothetical protein [Emergencia timonensis]|uniref:hypothetical protein n=1 Tax=Emergencia timonensis TaxID=1776384 RepID=UPI0039931838